MRTTQASAKDIGVSRYLRNNLCSAAVLVQSKRHHEGAIPEQPEQRVLSHWETREQVGPFSEYRLADEQRGVKFPDARGGLEVKSFGSIKESDQRLRINDGSHRARSP